MKYLDVTYPPARPHGGILLFIAQRTRISRAGHGPGAGVDANLQPHGVDLVREVGDAVGELVRVRDEVPGGVASAGPAVVQHDVLVAEVPEAQRDDLLGRVEDHRLVQAAAEGVPGVLAISHQH